MKWNLNSTFAAVLLVGLTVWVAPARAEEAKPRDLDTLVTNQRLKQLAAALGLSDEQKEKMRPILFEEVKSVRAVREACGNAHLKVILETGELVTLDTVSRASWLVMLAGADFIKTSTGKVQPAATPPVALVMLSAARDFAAATGRRVGVKVAGGVRTAKDAIRYLVLVRETAGPDWLSPDYFRIGASSLLNDLLMQRSKQLTGAYAGPDYFTLD